MTRTHTARKVQDSKAPKTGAPVVQLDDVEPRWFAVYTMAKREKMVAKRLEQKKISYYLPLQHVTRYYTRKVKHLDLPLIKGYIFVQITQRDYVPVLETPDVVHFVKFKKDLIAIPEHEIDLIRRVVGDQLEVEVEALSLSIGDEVEIIGGHLTGIRGKMVDRGNKHEVLLELTTIGMALRVGVKEEYLRKV